MPRISRLATIAPELRAQLHHRLAESGFGDVTAIAEWLGSVGVHVRKSAVGAYALEHRHAIETDIALAKLVHSPTRQEQVRLRMACAQAAATACAGRPDLLLTTAGELSAWLLDTGTTQATEPRRSPPRRSAARRVKA